MDICPLDLPCLSFYLYSWFFLRIDHPPAQPPASPDSLGKEGLRKTLELLTGVHRAQSPHSACDLW